MINLPINKAYNPLFDYSIAKFADELPINGHTALLLKQFLCHNIHTPLQLRTGPPGAKLQHEASCVCDRSEQKGRKARESRGTDSEGTFRTL